MVVSITTCAKAAGFALTPVAMHAARVLRAKGAARRRAKVASQRRRARGALLKSPCVTTAATRLPAIVRLAVTLPAISRLDLLAGLDGLAAACKQGYKQQCGDPHSEKMVPHADRLLSRIHRRFIIQRGHEHTRTGN